MTALRLLVASIALASLPALANPNCKMLRFAEWPVQVESGRLLAQARMNSREVRVMLHTALPHSLIRRAAADRLGVTLHQPPEYRDYGGGGVAPVLNAFIDEVRIGDSVHKGWRLLLLPSFPYPDDVDVVLGQDLFRQADVEFDLANKTVRLYRVENCGELPLAYWTREAAGQIRLDGLDESIAVSVQLNGKTVPAEINSAAPASAVSRGLAASLGMTPRSGGVSPGAKQLPIGHLRVASWIGTFQSFALGEEKISNPSLHFAEFDVPYMAGNFLLRRELRPVQLGLDFLRAHRVLVAQSQGKLYFTYVGGPVFTTGR